ncbi:MAG: 50S ribosomal protein L13 [bacterium]|nr:50S ribosomal protein L13 [bacterium]
MANEVSAMQLPDSEIIVLDGKNKKMGRLASVTAKLLLEGRQVIVVNAKDIVLTGTRRWVLEYWHRKVSRSDIANPRRYGPKIPLRPDLFFKRVVRGMLPRKQWKGRAALKRLKVYIGFPQELADKYPVLDLQEIDISNTQLPRNKVVRLGELLQLLGWKPRGE